MVISDHISIQILFILTTVAIISDRIPIQLESWDFMKCGEFLDQMRN